MKRSHYMRYLLGCSLLAAPAMAWAQGPSVLDEIVVTAQKREERLQDVPLSVAVVGERQLERQQVNRLADLSRVTPSLEVQQAPGQSVGGGGQIRGIGTQSFQAGAVGSVGIVLDQVSQGNLNISDLFDIQRVEVLKGPQGTLFGLTTSAGVINITTNAPVFGEYSGRLRTELSKDGTAGSKYGQQTVQGVVNLPLGETVALRVAGNLNRRQGVNRNTFTGDLDEQESYGLRGRLLWEPNERTTVNLIADYNRSESNGGDFFVIYKAVGPLIPELARCGIVASEGNRDYCTTNPRDTEEKSYGLSAQIDHDLGPVTLTSITAYRHIDSGPNYGDIFRLDVHPLRIVSGPGTNDSDLLTQELRIASPTGQRLEYTAGVFYSNQKSQTDPSRLLIRAFPAPGIVIPVVNNPGSLGHVDSESYAVFGQASLGLTDKLRLIAGARYTDETLDVDTRQASGAFRAVSTNITNVSWRIGPQYKFSENAQAYAIISRGYKGPQIAAGDPSIPTSVPTIIRPELPTNYEAGFKATLLDGRLLADLSAFYLRLKDYQGQQCTPNAAGGLSCVPQNISMVISKGVEANLFGELAEGLTMSTGLIWNPVEYPTGFRGQDGSALGGEQLLAVPEWKFTLSAEYSRPISASLRGFVSADTVFKSEMRYAASTDPNVLFDSHWISGGRVGVRSEDSRWSASVFVRNITDEHEPVIRFANFPDGSTGSYAQILTPQSFRLVGVSLDARF